MKNKIEKLIAQAWMDGTNPMEMIQKQGMSLPDNFIMPTKPNFKSGEEIARNATTANHMASSYCYCG